MENTDIMNIKLERRQVLDVTRALLDIISCYDEEIRNPKTSPERKEIAKKSLEKWLDLRSNIREQFVAQDEME